MKGRCLCGAVTVTTPDNPAMSACHCGMCRRWGGGPMMSVGLFQQGPEFQFREQIFIDQKPDSYDFANATARLTEAEVFAKYAAR